MRDLLGRRLGDFEIVREIGHGGMGIVYEARQVSLNRQVALKVLSAGLGLTPKAVDRFRREAEAAAKLHHTNIVPVYATGEEGHTHFYAMELIEGPSLDRVLKQLRSREGGQLTKESSSCNAPPPSDRLVATGSYVEPKRSVDQSAEHPIETGAEGQSATAGLSSSSLSSDSHYFDTVAKMIAEVADALEHAHRNGVIHRDMKPSNLLLSPDGRLSINDFGLARMLEQPGMTMSGEFVGTPAYMSPEQITAGRTPLDHRTDIYSLGATLYELLTLRPPFTGERRDEILAQIIHKEPKPPAKLNKKVPLDLETICLKALDKDPDRRYQTAGEMAEDLRRYVNRFAILARRAGPIVRLVKWIRRRPALAAALACAFAALLVAGLTMYQARVAEQRHLAAQRQQALERAMLEAMSGNFEAAEAALQEAALAGATTGQARMVDGLVAQYRGNLGKAIERYEQAVQLMPDSVAARGMLSTAYFQVGQMDKASDHLLTLERLSPWTPEDYLFKAQAEDWDDPKRALGTLNEAIRLYNRPLARVIRAEVRALQVLDKPQVPDAEEALKDARAATDLLPNNALALTSSVQAHLAAAGVFDEAGNQSKRQECLAQAAKDAEALAHFASLPMARLARLSCFQMMGDQLRLDEECRRVEEKATDLWSLSFCIWRRYCKGEFEKALELVDRSRSTDRWGTLIIRMFILAELPDGPSRAWRAYRDLLKQPEAAENFNMVRILNLPYVLLRLGRPQEASAAARQVLQHPELIPQTRREWHLRQQEYYAGQVSEEQFLQEAKGSRWNLCEGHFTVGLGRLALGDRAGAREQFRLAVATRVYLFFEHQWAFAFLTRMDKNPNWPGKPLMEP